jgi:putative transposase
VTNLHQDMGDTCGRLGGDTSAARLRWCLLMNPLIPVSALRSRSGLRTQADAFDHIYNTQRPHQGLPGRITPLTAWEATPKADPPRPKPDRPVYRPPVPALRPRPKPPADLPADTRIRKTSSVGTINVDKVFYKIDVDHAFEQVLVVSNGKPGRRQVHHHRHPRPDPRRAHQTRTRHPLRRQRPAPGTPPEEPGTSPRS